MFGDPFTLLCEHVELLHGPGIPLSRERIRSTFQQFALAAFWVQKSLVGRPSGHLCGLYVKTIVYEFGFYSQVSVLS